MTVDTVGWQDDENLSAPVEYWTPGERWYFCDYCGWIFPESECKVESHTGRRACEQDFNSPTEHDEALIARRNQIIFSRKEEHTGDE